MERSEAEIQRDRESSFDYSVEEFLKNRRKIREKEDQIWDLKARNQEILRLDPRVANVIGNLDRLAKPKSQRRTKAAMEVEKHTSGSDQEPPAKKRGV